MIRPLIAACAVVVAVIPAVAAAGESPALEHPAVQELLAMADAGVDDDVILARVDQIGSFPVLDGRDLAELKRRGVSDEVLLKIILLASAEVPSAPLSAPAEAEAASTSGTIRVVINRPFRVSYWEVVVNGELVASEGRIWEGSVAGGDNPERPAAVGSREPFIAWESEVVAATHSVAVGFAVSGVEGAPADEWSDYAGGRYVTRGIRAMGEKLPGSSEDGNSGAVCNVAAGQVCEVTATFDRSSPGRVGGLSVFDVDYRVEVGEAD